MPTGCAGAICTSTTTCASSESSGAGSAAEDSLAAVLAKRGQRSVATGARIGQHLLELGAVAERVELRGLLQRRRHEVALGHRALQLSHATLVITHVAGHPRLLEH